MKNLFKNFNTCLVLLCISLCTSLLVFSHKVYADTLVDYEKIYNQGVQENHIDPKTLSLEDWLKENEEYKRVYDEGINAGVLQSDIKYDEWIKANCYGQPPIADNEKFEEFEIKNKAALSLIDFQAGDILITNGTSSFEISGHAAIATSNRTILDITGPGETTRQPAPQDWINQYINEGWVKVYRMKDSRLAASAARWADTHYYSTVGGSQNIYPTYDITLDLYSTDSTYCSKIVFQACWYGTGSSPVMRPMTSFVEPYALINCFNTAYTPSLIAVTYQ